jgi:hypothetical protein
MFQTKVLGKMKKKLILFSILFFPKNRAVYEIMWAKYGTARQVTDDNIIRRMRKIQFAFRKTKARTKTQTHIFFPWHQWLRERA